MHTMALRARGDIEIAGFPKQPTIGIALGDQVYVDPEPAEHGPDRETLAAFGGRKSDDWYFTGNANDFYRSAYRAYFLNEPMNAVLSSIPTVMVWDDHEIRDGWGSHGDEAQPTWASWFQAAGQFFVDWQLRRGPQGKDAVWHNPDSDPTRCVAYPQSFDIGAVHSFILDTRTCRTAQRTGNPGKARPSSILGTRQLAQFESWIAPPQAGGACTPGRVWAIGSAAPLFVTSSASMRPNVALALGRVGTRGEIDDDLRDSWGHPSHAAEQARVVGAITKRIQICRDEQVLVLSGDVHQSKLIGLSLSGKNVGYEIVSSGVAADVDDHDGMTWYGTDPYSAPGSAMRGDWLGTVGTAPSFAEVRVKRTGAGNSALSVAWFVFAGYGTDNIANAEPFLEAGCGKSRRVVTLAAERQRCNGKEATRPPTDRLVLVEDLATGGSRDEVRKRFQVSFGAFNSVNSELHASAAFSHRQLDASTPLGDLSKDTLCKVLDDAHPALVQRDCECR